MTFAWLPHRCIRTNKRIWLKRAYRGTAIWPTGSTPAIEHRWMLPDAFLMSRLMVDYDRR